MSWCRYDAELGNGNALRVYASRCHTDTLANRAVS